ncbi:hypothetical protein KP509_1Z107100 [Ceratopteris richardii]|nr:hypothetical protein KP509_1Z107100 [Ceratopteris richardii]KAH6557564.1 hypothetical protein KP509_1Z107100 [Ceratopteris richardii]KAH6557567.1 hypothetical protein KP509_1Z107100 [Ceratopteris richardii]
MGAGITAVSGVENEPSSHRTDIAKAQAELRQELSGRNELQRELEFLEKGGDPLEFKFGEPLPSLWSLSPQDPLIKDNISGDEGGGIANTIADSENCFQEDGSDLKRARGVSGKFCYQDFSSSSISIERNTGVLPASIICLAENDKKDLPKNNKVTVKGQYARRNRQRGNRFSNGLSPSWEMGKVGTGDKSNVSSTLEGAVVSIPETKDITKTRPLQHVTVDEVSLQTENKDAVAMVAKEKGSVSSNFQLPDASTLLHTSAHDHPIESHGCGVSVHESVYNDGGLKESDQMCTRAENWRDTNRTISGEEQSVSVGFPNDEQKKHATTELSHGPLHFGGSHKAEAVEDKPQKQISSNDLKSEATMIKVLSTLECQEVANDKTISANEPVSQQPKILDSSDLDNVVQVKHESLMEKDADGSQVKPISDSHVQSRPVEIKVKLEDGMPVVSTLLPLNISNSQETAASEPLRVADDRPNDDYVALESQLRSDPNMLDEKLSIISKSEERSEPNSIAGKRDLSDSALENTNIFKPEPDNLDSLKDPMKGTEDRAKGKGFQEVRQTERAKGKNFREAPRKSSHWDFVLQEMAWLANDYMQERLWKMAAAAQLARWVLKEKQQLELEEMEFYNRQRRVAQGVATLVKKFWQSMQDVPLEEVVQPVNKKVSEATGVEAAGKRVKSSANGLSITPIQAYAIRLLKGTSERKLLTQAEAPLTPDRVSEFGIFDFCEDDFSEESLFYSVPENAMEIYRQSVQSQWEGEYERRLQEHEATILESESQLAGEGIDYPSGNYSAGSLASPLITGKRTSGFFGGSQMNRGSIPTKRMRTSAVAARQRAAGGTGPLVSIPVSHLARSDISSCETNSQQDELTGFLEGSSVSGRATDVDSHGAFARNSMAADGVDSPFKSKRKKKTRHFGGHAGLARYDRDSDQLQHSSHRQNEQKEQLKHKGDQAGSGHLGLEGLGTTVGTFHGTTSATSSASKLIKQIASRDRNRKYKGGKASLSQPGVGIPWSPVEDQAILGLVHELGLNWELVSDILSSASQLRGVFRKPKDCKERYRLLTERGGGDGGESPGDPNSSAHHAISLAHKGGTRYLPQHLEETLKSHVDCILQLYKQLRGRKLQNESQEPKQLVPEHESHIIKHTAMTPLELCELSSSCGDLACHSYPLQHAHGNGLGVPSMLASGSGIRSNSSAVPASQGVTNLQMSPSMSPSTALNTAATRDAQRMGMPMRPLGAEDRLRYNRMVTGRGLQNQGFSVTSGSSLPNLAHGTDGATSSSLVSGNSGGTLGSLGRGMPMARTGLPTITSHGVPNVSSVNNTLSSGGSSSIHASTVNTGALASPVNIMRQAREAISMGHSPSAPISNINNSLPNQMASSPSQNFNPQHQILQHNALQSQQQSPSSSQQQAYNMMRAAKERQQLQQQQQKRMLQQQQNQTATALQPPFQSSQLVPVSQQQNTVPAHTLMFSQHQPSHLMMQSSALQEQQHASSLPQSAVSPSGQSPLSGGSQSGQQQQSLSQGHHPTAAGLSSQSAFQSKHQGPGIKQQQLSKNMKSTVREGQPNIVSNQVPVQMPGQTIPQGQRLSDSQGSVPQHLPGGPSGQNMSPSLTQASDAGSQQQISQKGFPQHLSGKHLSQQHLSHGSSVQPVSPPVGVGTPQPQTSLSPVGSLVTSQRRAGQQSQGQQRKPQQSQATMNLSTQLASQLPKTGIQANSGPSQLPTGFQLGASTTSSLSMASPSSVPSLSSPSNANSGVFPSAQWKPGQSFTPMAAGLYNLSRSNSGIAAQAPHLAMSVGMHLPLPNGKMPVTGSSLGSQEISRAGPQHVPGHVGNFSQKASIGSTVNSRPVGVSQHNSTSQRQLAQQQQHTSTSNTGGQQSRPTSSASAPE